MPTSRSIAVPRAGASMALGSWPSPLMFPRRCCDLLEPLFVDFFCAFGAAFRLPFFCVHFITVSASVSNSAVIWSRVLPAQTASRIFLHDGLLDDAACNAMGHDAQPISAASANVRYRISWFLSPKASGRIVAPAHLGYHQRAPNVKRLDRRVLWLLHE